MTIPQVVRLGDALEELRFGGKASQSAAAIRAGLPVPEGFAIASESRGCLFGESARTALATMLHELGGLVAVRSSAVGEDSAGASFAGQYATVLGVRTVDGMVDALREVYSSATGGGAAAYREKMGLDPEPRMGIIIQKLVRAEAAGVLFSRDPITGQDVRVVEASWGLGEAVVQGLVNPDRFRIARGGEVLAREAGEKDLMICWAALGGSEEVPVAKNLVHTLCLDDATLVALDSLTTQCETVFGGSQDLEFAVAERSVHLLQRRAITRA